MTEETETLTGKGFIENLTKKPSPRTKRILKFLLAFIFLVILVQMFQSTVRKHFEGEDNLSGDESPEKNDQDEDEAKLLGFNDDWLNVVYSSQDSDKTKPIGPREECDPEKISKVSKTGSDYEILSADCGLGYDYENSKAKKERWSVALFGKGFNKVIVGLSGCPLGKRCPFSPRCEIFYAETHAEAERADVIVIFQNDYHSVTTFRKKPGQYKVLYWREAYLTTVPMELQKRFDLQMGVHWFSGVLNPQFVKTPASLLGGILYPRKNVIEFIPVEKRSNFAMSVISVCFALSRRQQYIDKLVQILGKNRIHQYGKCGDMELPPPPLKNAAKVIATYKFYLSFENTIEDGYVTEKLLQVLAVPVVPIYFGTPVTPNITITPSFIKASDFGHARKLSEYLLYLDSHPEEYNKYHEWRTNPKLFHPDYLKIMQKKSPGPNELLAHEKLPRYPRATACCRLCDANYLQWAAEERSLLVESQWNAQRIQKAFFVDKET